MRKNANNLSCDRLLLMGRYEPCILSLLKLLTISLREPTPNRVVIFIVVCVNGQPVLIDAFIANLK